MNWVIERLECKPLDGNLQNVVIVTHWRCIGEAYTDVLYSASVYGSCVFSDIGNPFIEYENLTQDIVLGWVWGEVNKNDVEASVQSELDKKVSPPLISLPLPWLG